jgi:hypothetical protein
MLRSTFVLALSLFTVSAFAANKKAKDPRSSETIETERVREFSIPVPQSEIKLEDMRYVAPRPVDIAVNVSSWVPENLTRDSYSGKVSRFERGETPSLSLNRIGQFVALDNGGLILSSKIGISYFTMDRTTGRSAGHASAGSSTETLNFLMGRVGVESAWPTLLPWGLEPNMSFSVLPTWLSAHESQYEDKFAVFGLPYEATAGILWRSNGKRTGEFGDLSFGVSGQAVSGNVAGSSLKGLGVLGELRVSL